MLKTIVSDPINAKTARLHKGPVVGDKRGLTVYSSPSRDYEDRSVPFLDDEGNLNLNVDASFSGTPDRIHDGTDTILWAASAISGTWDFASTAEFQAGTKSIDATATVDGDQALFTRSSPIASGSYTALTGYIFLVSFNPAKHEVLMNFRLAGVDDGVSIDITTFVNTSLFNVWQKFSIPLTTFGVSGSIDEMVVQTVRNASSPPDYYLDTMQLEEAGGKVYSVKANPGTRYEVSTLEITVAATLDTRLADATMLNLTWDEFFGLPALSGGLTLRWIRKGVVQFSVNFKHVGDMLFTAFSILPDNSLCDGTESFIKLAAPLDEVAVVEDLFDDSIDITVSDNLESLLQLRVVTRGRELIPAEDD